MANNKYGVAVVTCNRLALLRECVQAIQTQTVPIDSVVIVNNASTDGTKEYLDGIKGGNLQVVHLPENVGGAGGFAAGLEVLADTDVDWVLIIDDDAIIRSDFIMQLDGAIAENRDSYSAYAGVVVEDGQPSIFHRKRLTATDAIGHAVEASEYNKHTFVCDIASFCGLLIDRRLLHKFGLPKKEYFIWHDDTEFCLRINADTQILNVNAAKLDHKRKAGASDVHDWKNYYGLRNSLDIFRKYSKKQYYKEIVKISIRCIKALLRNDKRLVQIYTAVLTDNMRRRLGINNKFLPGR